VPEHVVALDDPQVSVVDCPAVMVVGDADNVAVTAGQVQTTDTVWLTSGVPGAGGGASDGWAGTKATSGS